MKKILVTGSDGFIGSHLTEELVKAGYQVKAFVYYNSFNTWGWLSISVCGRLRCRPRRKLAKMRSLTSRGYLTGKLK